MKLQHFILAGFLGLVFASCDLSGRAEHTPHISFRAMRIVDGDTTFLRFTHAPLDTLVVGDTVFFQTGLDGVFHALSEFSITRNRDSSADFIWGPKDSLNKYFTSASDFDKAIFKMPETYSALNFPFQLVAKEADENLTLTFNLRSTASRDFNTTAVPIRIPIKEAEEEKEELE